MGARASKFCHTMARFVYVPSTSVLGLQLHPQGPQVYWAPRVWAFLRRLGVRVLYMSGLPKTVGAQLGIHDTHSQAPQALGACPQSLSALGA